MSTESLEQLQQQYRQLKQKHETLLAKHEKLERVAERFRQEIVLLRDKRFGRSRDEVPTGQQDLDFVFDEAEVVDSSDSPVSEEEESITVPAHTRRKKGRKPLPADLPRVITRVDIDESEKQCACGDQLVEIGMETAEKLVIIPEQRYVEQIQRPKYACHTCEGSGDEDRPAVRIADPPPSIIPRGIATPGLLATVMTNKFIDHLPYYRQEHRFARLGIPVSRQDMSKWQIRCMKVIEPLLDLLTQELYRGPVLQMDETALQVLKEPGRKATQKSYMWLARGGPPDTPVMIYRYFENRSSVPAEEILKEFSGYVQADGYGAYDTALRNRTDVVLAGCWAHARRHFTDAAKVTKKAASAHEAVAWIKKLYTIEQRLRAQLAHNTLSLDEFTQTRKEEVTPVLTAFNKWLKKKQLHTPSSLLLGKAITYTLNQWEKLVRYLDSPYLTPDNNAAERGMKMFVTGRKNWLFSGTPAGANSSCALFSLIETAKSCNINPYAYLYHIFEQAPSITTSEQWELLLPWNVQLPASIGSIPKKL